MNDIHAQRFAPRDGALLDLESLQSLEAIPGRVFEAWASIMSPEGPGLILEGLEPEAPLAAIGPPGTRRPDSTATGLRLTAGRVLMRDVQGRYDLIEVPQPTFVAWPTTSGARVTGALVLKVDRKRASAPGGLQVAREEITVQLGFVRPGSEAHPGLFPLAMAFGNGKDWITDIHRAWSPEHPVVQHLERRLDEIERLIWRAEPEGSVWDRQVLGRNWVRYQTMAAASLQSVRVMLRTRTLTTTERVRLFVALRDQLGRSVQSAGTALVQFFRPAESAGPYAVVSSTTEG
ncbi:MAG: hypothetical protein CL927_10290 [Deltaproteobacteria bacterium]|nr:hypothetical protein [Deltaproteobacteria bacterium]